MRGPRSSSVALRCSDSPGGATHFGSGLRANSTACSASVRNALAMTSAIPSARAAAAMRSNACATSGRIGLPWRYAERPVVPAAGGERGRPDAGRRRELGLGPRPHR